MPNTFGSMLSSEPLPDGPQGVPGAPQTPADAVTSETAFGQSAGGGAATTYSRGDHTHGSPADAVPAHAALTTVHAAGTNLEKTAAKGAVSGYAPLDTAQKVPTANLGGAGASASNYLRGDQTWVTPPGGGITTLKKTADQTVNGTPYVNIADLTFPVVINTDYAFDFYITFRSVTTTTGFRFSVLGPAGCVVDYMTKYQTVVNASGLATWLERHDVAYEAMAVLTATVALGVDLHCRITGRIKVGATPGTLAARVASELANNDLVVQKGSWGTYF